MSYGRCSVCSADILYKNEVKMLKCEICGKEEESNIWCSNGHYLCADCCAKEVMENIRKEIPNITLKNPIDIGDYILAKCGIAGHTPHVVSAVSFLVALKNTTGRIDDAEIEEGLKRGYKIPAGWCGYYGACGAGVGIGVAFSIVLGSTPSSDRERSVANYATSACLKKIAFLGGPCCCIGSVRAALSESVQLAKKFIGVEFPESQRNLNKCWASKLQVGCRKKNCIYYGKR